MRNQLTTNEHYTMQLMFPLENVEEKIDTKRKFVPTFKAYDNKQMHMILDITYPCSPCRSGH